VYVWGEWVGWILGSKVFWGQEDRRFLRSEGRNDCEDGLGTNGPCVAVPHHWQMGMGSRIQIRAASQGKISSPEAKAMVISFPCPRKSPEARK
jgi:hypothetical protein